MPVKTWKATTPQENQSEAASNFLAFQSRIDGMITVAGHRPTAQESTSMMCGPSSPTIQLNSLASTITAPASWAQATAVLITAVVARAAASSNPVRAR